MAHAHVDVALRLIDRADFDARGDAVFERLLNHQLLVGADFVGLRRAAEREAEIARAPLRHVDLQVAGGAEDRVEVVHGGLLFDHDHGHDRVEVLAVAARLVAGQRGAARLDAHSPAALRVVGADRFVDALDIVGGADVGEEHGLEACAERGLGPEGLVGLVQLDHQRQVAAALRRPRHVVEQAHVERRILGDVLGVIEHARVADDFGDVGIVEEEVGADCGFAGVELFAQGVGRDGH